MLLHRFLNIIFQTSQKKRLRLKHQLVKVTYVLLPVPELVQLGQADRLQVSILNILIAQYCRLNSCQRLLKAAEHQLFKHIISFTILFNFILSHIILFIK